MNTTWVLSNGQIRTLQIEYHVTGVQDLMCPNNGLLRGHRIVEEDRQENHSKAYIHDAAELIFELYDSDKGGLQN